MPEYEKKVVYLSLWDKGSKIKSAGYIRVEVRNQTFTMDMHINIKDQAEDGKFKIMANAEGEAVMIGMIPLHKGEGNFQDRYPVHEIGIMGQILTYDTIETFEVILEDDKYVLGVLHPAKRHTIKMIKTAALPEMQASQAPVVSKALPVSEMAQVSNRTFSQAHNEEIRKKLEDVRMTPNKWQQLLKSYKQIHPYGDERVYISIEPKDFVIIGGEYQHLAHNSFLLHGFYNYRHVILGEDKDAFYLGVPGVYYEREKMVATMFGFEAFECEGGKADNGKFGYYLKKIKL